MKDKVGETEVELRVDTVEAWEPDITEQAGKKQACSSVQGLPASSATLSPREGTRNNSNGDETRQPVTTSTTNNLTWRSSFSQ